MKWIGFALMGLLFLGQGAAAFPTWSAIAFTTTPQNAPQVVAATDKFMNSAVGRLRDWLKLAKKAANSWNQPELVEKLGAGVGKFHRGVGCRTCRNTGYLGRIAIHELFIPNEEAMEMINERAGLKKLRNKAIHNGMIPLQMDGIEKVKAGIVSIEEVLRTSQTEV